MVPCYAPTRWEVIITNGEIKKTLRLTARHTKRALFNALSGKWELLRDTLALADDAELALDWDNAAFCWRFRATPWIVCFDRTEREIKNQ